MNRGKMLCLQEFKPDALVEKIEEVLYKFLGSIEML